MRTRVATSAPSAAASAADPSFNDAPADNQSPAGPPLPGVATPPSPLASTRASRTWNSLIPALILLGLILLFVFQNLHDTRVKFLTFSATLPVGLALLAAAAVGGLFVLALGSVRMVQLRKVIRRSHRANTPNHQAETSNHAVGQK